MPNCYRVNLPIKVALFKIIAGCFGHSIAKSSPFLLSKAGPLAGLFRERELCTLNL